MRNSSVRIPVLVRASLNTYPLRMQAPSHMINPCSCNVHPFAVGRTSSRPEQPLLAPRESLLWETWSNDSLQLLRLCWAHQPQSWSLIFLFSSYAVLRRNSAFPFPDSRSFEALMETSSWVASTRTQWCCDAFTTSASARPSETKML